MADINPRLIAEWIEAAADRAQDRHPQDTNTVDVVLAVLEELTHQMRPNRAPGAATNGSGHNDYLTRSDLMDIALELDGRRR